MFRLFCQSPAIGLAHGIRPVTAYLSAGPLLHGATVTALAVSIAVAVCMPPHPLKVAALAGLGLVAVFAQLDARSRFQEFKQVRDQLFAFGPDPRIFRSMAGSRCRRDAALAAAWQRGCAAGGRRIFRSAGYRWYHLLPDRVCQTPGILLTPAFWRGTFFVPTYHSRYPFHPVVISAPSHGRAPWSSACRRPDCG